jgi:hypothetical protein
MYKLKEEGKTKFNALNFFKKYYYKIFLFNEKKLLLCIIFSKK